MGDRLVDMRGRSEGTCTVLFDERFQVGFWVICRDEGGRMSEGSPNIAGSGLNAVVILRKNWMKRQNEDGQFKLIAMASRDRDGKRKD